MNTQTKNIRVQSMILILVVAALLVGAVLTTRSVARAAIPGDALYPLKTSIEQTRLSLAGDAGDRAQMKMTFAEQRLVEISALIEDGRYSEVSDAVLAFESELNAAILELETIAQTDPARAAGIALEITSALTRYAQTLSVMASTAPESVRLEVIRALDTTQIAGSLELPSVGSMSDDNSNENGIDVNSNDNGLNVNSNGNGIDGNSNDNGIDDNSNDNGVVDNTNDNGVDDNSNDNGGR